MSAEDKEKKEKVLGDLLDDLPGQQAQDQDRRRRESEAQASSQTSPISAINPFIDSAPADQLDFNEMLQAREKSADTVEENPDQNMVYNAATSGFRDAQNNAIYDTNRRASDVGAVFSTVFATSDEVSSQTLFNRIDQSSAEFKAWANDLGFGHENR